MKSDFFKYQAQTSPHPLSIEVSHAKGSYIYDIHGKKYLDFVAGVSANSLGHNHPKVSEAIKNQVDKYTHVMVYGEFIQEPQVDLCKLLASTLPCIFFNVFYIIMEFFVETFNHFCPVFCSFRNIIKRTFYFGCKPKI